MRNQIASLSSVIVALIALMVLNGCATYNEKSSSYTDPMSGFNRVMFDFNYNILDPYLLRPVAVVWKDYVPSPIRSGISGVSSNFTEPASAVNSLLQGDIEQTGKHLARFMLNTLLGFGGLIDLASMADPKLQRGNRQTFGRVLGHYDVPYGPYVVLPFYGQATLREDGGALVDNLYLPLSFEVTVARWIFGGIESRAQAIEYEELLNGSDDSYNFMRNAYFQRLDFLASDDNVDEKKQQQREAVLSDYLDDIDGE